MKLSKRNRGRLITLLIFLGILYFLPISNLKSLKAPETPTSSDQKVLGANMSTITPSFYLEYIVITATPLPSLTPTTTPIPTATPTPIATPKPVIKISSNELDQLFEKYSKEYGVDKNLLAKIALCESGFNSGSRNGLYAGMFQFNASSWARTRTEMGLSTNPDLRTDAHESIKTAAYKMSKYGTSSWPACSR